MKVYEFGKKENPVLLLLPGTCCHWKLNFGHVIEELSKTYRVACVSYDGFDETEESEFPTMIEETEKIEKYIKKHYGGRIYGAYGCSLGGSFVGLMIARRKVAIAHGIIGSSDLDQAGKVSAWIQTKLTVPLFYQYMHEGRIHNGIIRRKMEKNIRKMGDYGKAFVHMISGDGNEMRFVTKKSIKNQFYSDLVTALPRKIKRKGTTIHVFYATKMGEKYRSRYEEAFDTPDIIEQDLRHEELLALYPDKWILLVQRVCPCESTYIVRES